MNVLQKIFQLIIRTSSTSQSLRKKIQRLRPLANSGHARQLVGSIPSSIHAREIYNFVSINFNPSNQPRPLAATRYAPADGVFRFQQLIYQELRSSTSLKSRKLTKLDAESESKEFKFTLQFKIEKLAQH